MTIDWETVNKHVRTPCGCRAKISPGTDGFEITCTWTGKLTREEAQRISDDHAPKRDRLQRIVDSLSDDELERVLAQGG